MLNKKFLTIFIGVCISTTCHSQSKLYRPYTKWYQDPLGLRPVELSSATGFIWGSAAVLASILFTKQDSGFHKRLSVYHETGYGFGYKPPYTNMLQTETGVSYDVRKWMSVSLGWNVFHFSDRVNNATAFGIRPSARWYLYRTTTTKLFFEYGAGVCVGAKRFPLTGTGLDADTARTGTRFNFTAKYGAGIIIRCNDRFSLQAIARHFHLSNGNIKGIPRNPSHDSNGFLIGAMYTIHPKDKG